MRSIKLHKSGKITIILFLLLLIGGCTPVPVQRGDTVTPVAEETVNQAAEAVSPAAVEDDKTGASEVNEVEESTEDLFDTIVDEETVSASPKDESDGAEESISPDMDATKLSEKNQTEFPVGEGAVLVYKRSGGLAGLEEAFTIYEDGRLTSNNEREWQADAQEVEELLEEIEELGFFEMDGTYIPKDQCCDRFSYELSVLDGEEVFTVRTIDAAPGAPNELWFVLDKVQQFVNGQTR